MNADRKAYAQRMMPRLRQELARLRSDIAAESHRLEVCETGRDPLFPPRLVPILALASRSYWPMPAGSRSASKRPTRPGLSPGCTPN